MSYRQGHESVDEAETQKRNGDVAVRAFCENRVTIYFQDGGRLIKRDTTTYMPCVK